MIPIKFAVFSAIAIINEAERWKEGALSQWIGGNRKRFEQSSNTDQILLETVFSFAICRQFEKDRICSHFAQYKAPIISRTDMS